VITYKYKYMHVLGVQTFETTSVFLMLVFMLFVGTPGRVYDMLRRGALKSASIKMFVLDEADEMLSRGFKDQVTSEFFLLITVSVLLNVT